MRRTFGDQHAPALGIDTPADTAPTALRWYPSATGGEPLACLLLDGDRAGETVTTVPAGTAFRFADPESVPPMVFAAPADS
jgi:hypothetical protein